MGFRFFRRKDIIPGVRLNFSKSGISPSFGVRGARVTLGRQGVRKTVGIPGTGLFYTEVGSKRGKRGQVDREGEPPKPQNFDLGFFERLTIPKTERAFVDGCKAYVSGDVTMAGEKLEQAIHLADGAFLAGFLAMDAQRLDTAEGFLRQALAKHASLGIYFEKYGLVMELMLPITEFTTAHIHPCRRGVLLGLAEICQAQSRLKEAIHFLRLLRHEAPDDVVVKLSLAELAREAAPDSRRVAKQLVELAGNVANESSVHAGLMLYKAQALRTLGLPTAARDVLTSACRKTKGRDEDLLRAIRYERACVYEELGNKTRARREFEKLYAEAPAYEDVADHLGL